MQISVNGQDRDVPKEWQEESLLHVLRDPLRLVGTKFGCGQGQCGACTVLVDGAPTRSCVLPVKSVGRQRIVTIEGLAGAGRLHPVQQAWLAEAVPQCGYCQAGQIMSTVALLERIKRPDDKQIDEALAGNLCRCGTQSRIRKAVKQAAAVLAGDKV
jgi:isoquinoline 1-oxidoreductase subunit alpha